MMLVRTVFLASAIAGGGFGSSSAACLPDGPPAEAFTNRKHSQRTAGLMVGSGMLLTMDAYDPAKLTINPVCEVATIRSDSVVYAVSGTADTAMPRVMIPRGGTAPLLYLLSIPDLTKLMQQPGQAPPSLGYVLATRDENIAMVFRAYGTIPPDSQLASEMAAALEGRIPPLLQADLATGQVRISVGEGAGLVADRPAPPVAEQ